MFDVIIVEYIEFVILGFLRIGKLDFLLIFVFEKWGLCSNEEFCVKIMLEFEFMNCKEVLFVFFILLLFLEFVIRSCFSFGLW